MKSITSALDDIFLLAEADVSNGAMVALIPAQKYVDLLALDGYEPPEQLHVTLLYLGKSVDWHDDDRERLREFVTNHIADESTIDAEIHSHAVFNPDSDEAASVYIIGGEGAVTCGELEAALREEVESGDYLVDIPHDHPFYLPHLTIGYDLDVDKLTYTGPISFDTVRVVFGGETTDLSLGGG